MILYILILIIELYFTYKVIKYFLLSPVYIYIYFSIISIVLSLWYFYYFDNKFSLFNLDKVTELVFINTIKMYLLALNSFLFGVLLFYELSAKRIKIRFNKAYSNSLFVKYKVLDVVSKIVPFVFLLILILYFITYGKGLFIRSKYLPETNRFLTIFLKVLVFVEIILLGIIYSNKKKLSTILFLLTIFLSITTGSRTVFLFFIFYICLVFISSGNNLFNKLRFILHLFISFVFLTYIMQLRSLSSHGLIPYIKSIGSSDNDFLRSFVFNLYYSFIYGVYVTIGTLEKAKLDWNIIFISINPFPGSMVGWYDYANNMRLNLFAPFSLHGRVFKTGYLFTIIYFFTTGLIFTYFENIIRKLLSNNKRTFAFLIIILLSLHIVYAFEYNMRAAIRYFYYVLFILFIAYLLRQVKKNLPKIKTNEK